MDRELRKSASDKVFLGVCGGIAEYMNIDSSIVRILLVIFTFLGGSGLLIYIIAALLIKSEQKNNW